MPKVTFIERDGTRLEIDAADGLSLLEIAHRHDIDCATCHVIVEPKWFEKMEPPSEDEEDMLDLAFDLQRTSRLGCQIIISDEFDGLTVALPGGHRFD